MHPKPLVNPYISTSFLLILFPSIPLSYPTMLPLFLSVSLPLSSIFTPPSLYRRPYWPTSSTQQFRISYWCQRGCPSVSIPTSLVEFISRPWMCTGPFSTVLAPKAFQKSIQYAVVLYTGRLCLQLSSLQMCVWLRPTKTPFGTCDKL